MKYFAFIDGEQRGPFELNELITAGVRPSTYIWSKDMDDWHRADEVPDVCRLFRQHLADRMHPKHNEHADSPRTVNPADHNAGSPASHTQEEEQRPRFSRFGIPESAVPEPDYNAVPQVSMALAIVSLLLCFPPFGIAAVVFAYKTQKTWVQAKNETDAAKAYELKKQAHDYARLSKMWLGLTVAIGVIMWTLVFSVSNKFH